MRIPWKAGARRWTTSIAVFAATGALGASLAYWTLQLLAPPVAIAPAGSLVDYGTAPDLASAQVLFGRASDGPVAEASAVSEVRVLGVAASAQRASAVLSIDSGAAKAYMIGDAVGNDMRLVDVRADAAVLERNGARFELPAPQRPSVALLSSGPASATPEDASTAAPVRASPAVPDRGNASPAQPAPPTDALRAVTAPRVHAGSGRAATVSAPALDATSDASHESGPAGAAADDPADEPR